MTIHAASALLEDGWANNVLIEIDAGQITTVTRDAAPGDAHRAGLLLPAPGNLHSHSFQRAMAGMTEYRTHPDDSFWTWRTLMYRFLDRLDPDQIEAIAALTFVEMLEAGFASVGEFHYLHHGANGQPYDDLAELSMRIAAAATETGIGLTHLPVLYMQGGADGRALEGGQRRFGNDPARFARLVEGAEAAIAPLPDARIGIAPHSLRAVSVDALTEIAALRPDAPLHMHIAEQRAEITEVLASHGATPVKWLLEIMDVDQRWCLIHATHMSPAETRGLARSGAVAGLCPITESNLGDGIFNAKTYLEAGGHFGIGADSNIRIALSEELRTFEYSQRLEHRARAVLATDTASTGRTLFQGALRGGAQAMGRNSGAIRPGAWADLLALDPDALALTGLTGDRALDGWIFAGDDRAVTDVWSAGRHMVQGGRHIARKQIEQRYRTTIATLRDQL